MPVGEVAGLGVLNAGARGPSIVRSEVRPDGVCVLTLDDPGKALTRSPPSSARRSALRSTPPNATGASARSSCEAEEGLVLVGANIEYLQTIRFAKDAEDASREVSKRFARIASLAKPVVACVHGAALGGGFELALACTATVATDDDTTLLGLPEVKLGLMPAANGLIRVAQRAGLKPRSISVSRAAT